MPGREGFIRSVAEEPAIFSNLRVNIYDQVAEGDKVTTRFTWKRIHDRGEFLGSTPTGMEITTTAIVINRVSGGKIVEEWSESTGVLEATRQRLEQERIERERIEQELRVARSIQQASLPKEVPSLRGWQITPYYRPAREVGGDFYDFHLLPEGRLGVVVGDATGKGVPAALVMSSARSMLRALARASDSPGEVLGRVNDALVTDIPPTCSSPASTPSSTPSTAPWSMPTRATTCPTCGAEGMPTNLGPRGCLWGLCQG